MAKRDPFLAREILRDLEKGVVIDHELVELTVLEATIPGAMKKLKAQLGKIEDAVRHYEDVRKLKTRLPKEWEIDAQEFWDAIAPQLYEYYCSQDGTLPPIDWHARTLAAKGAVASLRDTLQWLPIVNSPKLGKKWRTLATRLDDDLYEACRLLRLAEKEVVPTPTKRGARPKTARDALLASVVAEVQAHGVRAGLARDAAAKIVSAFGIAVPLDGTTLKRAVAKAKRT